MVEHDRTAFDQMLLVLRNALVEYKIKDVVVAVERTGRYHRPVQHAFANAGYDTRIVHPSISSYFREAAAYDNKTDDTDLEGIFRATVNGFGFQEQPWDAIYGPLQIWSRRRSDMVGKTTLLRCQIGEYLEACLPGYSRCFEDIFRSKTALPVARHFATPSLSSRPDVRLDQRPARLAGVQVHRQDSRPHPGLGPAAASP